MRRVTIVDARMGRGKSTAAIRYMNERKDERHFLYVTPYLSEVARVCTECGFTEPVADDEGVGGGSVMSKSTKLKALLSAKKNVASTHALFGLMDEEALTLAEAGGYSLIIDESPEVLSHVPASRRDTELILEHLADVDEDMRVIWREEDYEGKFAGYKAMADDGTLFYLNGTFYQVMSPRLFMPFKEVYLLTYLFEGQLARAYFDFYGFEYDTIGVETDDEGFRFSNKPDAPPPVDYRDLIRIVSDEKMNEIGDSPTALSVSWYLRDGRNGGGGTRALRKNLRNFFERGAGERANQRLWTSYKDYMPLLLGPRNRYRTSFLSLNARATNAYREAASVAYLVNRFIDPNIAKFFAAKDIAVDVDLFALSEMLQFIWRSAIRDGNPIDLYIPSRRMRGLLTGWITNMNGGD